VVVVGAGPAGLMAAQVAASAGASVLVIEANRTPGRKFLLAGRSGLNLSNTTETFLDAYGADASHLAPMITAFGRSELTTWCAALGEPVAVGSSGRLFPASWRAAPLLRSWLRRLGELGVELEVSTRWTGWPSPTTLAVDGPSGRGILEADRVVLACGGASWPRSGSDGAWTPVLDRHGIAVTPLRSANAGLLVEWSPPMLRWAGEALKDVVLGDVDGRRIRGDLVVVATGVQGTPAYSLSSAVGRARQPVELTVDLRPDLSEETLAGRLGRRRPGETTARLLSRIGLAPIAIALLNEHGRAPSDAALLAGRIKAVPLVVTGTESLERAISTAGGVRWSAVDERLALRSHPKVFVAGEMLDWDAPTGGYLLHACLATGAWAGRHAGAALS
jgi:uncharacterized flavoprotein (TIGR03862 family)